MAVRGIGLEAQQAHTSSRPDELDEVRERVLRIGRAHVGEEDLAHLGVMSGACGRASICRRSECAQVHIIDPGIREAGGELRLREARSPGARDRTDVHEQLDASILERAQEAVRGRALVSDRGEWPHDRAALRRRAQGVCVAALAESVIVPSM